MIIRIGDLLDKVSLKKCTALLNIYISNYAVVCFSDTLPSKVPILTG